MTDKKKLCSYEAGFEHKGHAIRELIHIKPEIDAKKSSIENSLENLELYHEQLSSLLEEQRQSLQKVTKERFEELAFLVKMKELEVSLGIDSFFSQEIKRLDKVLGKESVKRNNLLTKIADYKQGIQHKDIFKLIEEDITGDINGLTREVLRDQLVLFTEKSKELTKTLEKSLVTYTGALDHFDFSLKVLAENLKAKHPEESVDYIPKKIHTKVTPFEVNTALVLNVNEDWLDITAGMKANQATVIKAQDWRDIRKVRISLEEFEFREDDMRTLDYIFRAIEQVSCVNLNAKKQKIFQDNQLINLFKTLFWKPQNLQEIDLNFDWRKIGDQPLSHLVENNLSKAVNLKTLNFNLYKTSITDKTIRSLGEKALPHLKCLESVNINIGDTKSSAQGIEKLFIEMPKVRHYELGLSNSKVDDNGLNEFVRRTLPSMTKIETLNLRLLDTQVTDASILPIFERIKGIKALVMDLGRTKVTDEIVRQILKADFLNAKALGTLDIDLTHTVVTEDLKKELVEARRKVLEGL